MRAASKLWTPLVALSIGLSSPAALQAQIASPSNAGGNAGNNTSGASSTPISTPNFVPPTVVPVVSDVQVAPSGTITTTPAATNSVVTAVSSLIQTEQGSLSGVASGPAVPALVGSALTAPEITLTPQGGAGAAVTVSLQQLAQSLPVNTQQITAAGTTITVESGISGTSGTITFNQAQGSNPGTASQVAVTLPGGETVLIPVTSAASTQAMVQLAALAIAVGLSPTSLSTAANLVGPISPSGQFQGATPMQAVTLLAAVQGIGSSPNVTNLSLAINTLNEIVNALPASQLENYSMNPDFVAVRQVLVTARSAIAAAATR